MNLRYFLIHKQVPQRFYKICNFPLHPFFRVRQSSAAFSKVQDYGRSKMIVMPAIYPIFNRLSLFNCSYFPDFVNLVPEKIILFKMFLLSWVRLKAGRRYGLILAISSVTFDSTRDPSVLCPVRSVIDQRRTSHSCYNRLQCLRFTIGCKIRQFLAVIVCSEMGMVF